MNCRQFHASVLLTLCFSTSALGAPVVYNISGSISNQNLHTDNALNSVLANFWNPQDGSNLTACPGTLYSCTNTAATGDALGAGPASGTSTGLTGTVRPTFAGTLTVDTANGAVTMDIIFEGTVTFRTPDVFPPAPFSGAAVSEITNWRQVVTWTTGTVGPAAGSVRRGNSISTGMQICDWNNADSPGNATLCVSRQPNAAERAWGTIRNSDAQVASQFGGSMLPDCTGSPGEIEFSDYEPCPGITSATGDTNIDYAVAGASISGSGGYLERGWDAGNSQVRVFSYGLCTQTNWTLNQFSCGSRWLGALRDEDVSASTSTDDALAGGSLTFSGSLAAVPIPAGFWLFGSALGLLGWIRRRYLN